MSKRKKLVLSPKGQKKNRHDLLMFDYVHKLSNKEKEWLSQFNEEYVGGTFKKDVTPLHKSTASKRDCYNRNNRRYRDVLNRDNVVAGNYSTIESSKNEEGSELIQVATDTHKTEDMLIELIDLGISLNGIKLRK